MYIRFCPHTRLLRLALDTPVFFHPQNQPRVSFATPHPAYLSLLPLKLYCDGSEASNISVEGGTFRNNKALESGGAIALGGESGLVAVTGGTFENNHAT